MNQERIRTKADAQAPAVCFICEMVQGEVLVDMCRNFDPEQPMVPLRGRKYLCEGCIYDAATALDFRGDDIRELESQLDTVKFVLESVQEERDAAKAEQHKVVPFDEAVVKCNVEALRAELQAQADRIIAALPKTRSKKTADYSDAGF